MISAHMLPSLEQLTRAELVRRARDQELAYMFKHALVQDTVYASLLKQERRRLHQRVAESLEQTFPTERDARAVFRPKQMAPYLARTLETLAQVYEQQARTVEAAHARAKAAKWKLAIGNLAE